MARETARAAAQQLQSAAPPAAEHVASDEPDGDARSPAATPGAGEPPATTSDAEGASATAAVPATPRRGLRPVRPAWIVLWAASILVVALIVGGTVFGLASIRPVSPVTGAVQVDMLNEPTDPSVLKFWVGDDVDDVVAYEFEGLVVARLPTDMFGQSGGGPCFIVADASGIDEDEQSFSGRSYFDCGAGGFPATVQFLIEDAAPAALRKRFPAGTALQFILRDEGVGVFVDEAPSPSPDPTA